MRNVLRCAWLLLLATSQARAAVVSADQVQRAVEAFVRGEALSELAAGERLAVHARWTHDVQVEGAGPASVEVRRSSSRPLRGPTVVKVRLAVDGTVVRELSVTADVRVQGQVLVARRGVARGETFQADLVERAERDITMLRSRPFTEAPEVQGKRARRPLRPGDIVTADHLEAVPLVARGSSVRLVLQTARLELSALGEAVEDGGEGERIRVRNVDSGRLVEGVVVDARTVRLP